MKRVLKRSLSLLLAITIIFSSAVVGLGEVNFDGLFAVRAHAASSGICGTNVRWVLDDNGTLTISGTGAMRSVSNSNTSWTENKLNIKNIIIENSVTNIGYWAFEGCTNLTSITIPNSVTSIDGWAFMGCTNLTSVTIPDSVTSIDICAFDNCTNLTSVIIPDSVTSIGASAFRNTGYYNNSYNWENGVLYINKHLIAANKYVSYQYIGNIEGDYIIKQGTKTIAGDAFNNCTLLTSITIPDSVTSIGNSAFEGCTNLTSITIPNSVTSVGGRAFYDCESLATVKIGDGVTSIGNSAFWDCTSLTCIDVNWINKNFCSIDGVLFSKNKTRLIRYPEGKIGTHYTIPDSVTSIDSYAFDDCTSLTSVIIPDSVTSIGVFAFNNTGYYNNSNNWENDVLYIGNHLIEAKTSLEGEYTIKEGIKTIAEDAFRYCSLTSITIPDSIRSIGEEAFYFCTCLTSITIPDSVKSISPYTFGECYNLTSITIPDSVTSIGSNAFWCCEKLNSITIPNSVTSIGDMVFRDCISLTSIKIPDSVTSISSDAFEGCTNLSEINTGENNLEYASIGGVLFNKDKSTLIKYPEGKIDKSYVIPEKVINIGEESFCNCDNITSITIPDSVTSIEYSAFANCDSLQYLFYNGSKKDWTNIDIHDNNKSLINTMIHYNTTGHSYEEVTDVEATCTKKGVKHQECSVCEYRLDDETIPALGHDFSTEWYIDVEATCTKNGIKSHHCLRCNDKTDTSIITAKGHSYSDWNVDIEPTCIEDGSKFKICSACGDVITETISSTGHDYSTKWTIDIEPTCTEGGLKSHHCSVCGDKTDVTTIEAQGHNYTWMHNYEEKTKTGICSNCSEEKTDELLVTDVLTFTLNGDGASYTVTDCEFGYIGNMEIPSTYKGLPVIAIGTDAFRDCTAITSVVIPDSVKSIGGSAFRNCIGLTEISLSDNIPNIPGAMLFGCKNLKSIVIPDNVKRVDGYAFSGCSGLEYVFYENDEVEWTKVTIRGNNAPLTDAAIHFNSIGEHTYSAEWTIDVTPTCTVDGSKSRHCTGCELKTDITTIEAPGHNYSSEWTIDIVATCTEDGSKSHHCTICGDKTDITVIEAIGHNYVVAGTSFIHPHTVTCECLFCEDVKTESSAVLDCVECNFTINTIDSSSYKLVSYNGTESNVEIPSIYNGRAITTIANACFRGNTSIISIDISDGVTTIGSLAFMNCTSLKKVYIPASVTSIGANAFYGFAGIIYCTNGSFAHQYAIDNNFNYVLLSIQETENTQIDYVNLIIRTTVQSCADIEKILGISETAMAIPIASHMHGNLEYYGTGTIISVFDSNDYIGDYTLIVNGDTNGDSVCDVLDCAQVELASNGNADLLGAYAEAGDTNGDGVIDITDYQSIVNKAVS